MSISKIVNDFFNSKDFTNAQRNKLVEQEILKHQLISYIIPYAQHVIKGRWPLAEKLLIDKYIELQPQAHKQAYYRHRGFDDIRVAIFNYIELVIKGRWKEIEPILKSTQVFWVYYINKVLKKYGIDDIGTNQSDLELHINTLLDII